MEKAASFVRLSAQNLLPPQKWEQPLDIAAATDKATDRLPPRASETPVRIVPFRWLFALLRVIAEKKTFPSRNSQSVPTSVERPKGLFRAPSEESFRQNRDKTTRTSPSSLASSRPTKRPFWRPNYTQQPFVRPCSRSCMNWQRKHNNELAHQAVAAVANFKINIRGTR